VTRVAFMALCSAAAISGFALEAAAQPVVVDHTAPVRCFDRVTRAETIRDSRAMQLCTGATSVAPADCFSEVDDRLMLDDRDAVRMCRMASSRAPARCAARLDATGDFANREIVDYCAAQKWPTIAAPRGGAPSCVEAALDRTFLTELQAFDLCRSSTTSGPVECFEIGKARLTLADRELVQLCAGVVAVPYDYPRAWWR
jgi:hypothetical protein